MIVLYENAASGNCYKVRLLLAHLGVPYERRTVDVVDRSDRPELLGDLNPALRVPTIVFDDGRALGESGAILWYFGEGTRFVPDDSYARAQVLQWMFFEQYDHEPAIAVARFWLTLSGDPAAYADRLPERHAAGVRALAALERHLTGRRWLVGEAMTLADIALYAYTHVAAEGGFDLSDYPAIVAWLGRVAARARSRADRCLADEERGSGDRPGVQADDRPAREGARPVDEAPGADLQRCEGPPRLSNLALDLRSRLGRSRCAQLAPEPGQAALPRDLGERRLERRERGLLLVRERHEPTLEAGNVRLVAIEEVDQQVDARRPVGDVRPFADVASLQRRRNAEQPIGWIRLVAVLGQPDTRPREVARDEEHELPDRRHRDRRAVRAAAADAATLASGRVGRGCARRRRASRAPCAFR